MSEVDMAGLIEKKRERAEWYRVTALKEAAYKEEAEYGVLLSDLLDNPLSTFRTDSRGVADRLQAMGFTVGTSAYSRSHCPVYSISVPDHLPEVENV